MSHRHSDPDRSCLIWIAVINQQVELRVNRILFTSRLSVQGPRSSIFSIMMLFSGAQDSVRRSERLEAEAHKDSWAERSRAVAEEMGLFSSLWRLRPTRVGSDGRMDGQRRARNQIC